MRKFLARLDDPLILMKGPGMIRNTFIHIPGISKNSEKIFWESGFNTWSDYLQNPRELSGIRRTREFLLEWLCKSEEMLKYRNPYFFFENLPSREHWRLYPEFSLEMIFIGLYSGYYPRHSIIRPRIITIINSKGIHQLVQGENFFEFESVVKKYPIICTFNGRQGELKILDKEFSNALIAHLSIPVRKLLKDTDQSILGEELEEDYRFLKSGYLVKRKEMDILWTEHLANNTDALKRLKDICLGETMSLKKLFEYYCVGMKKQLYTYTHYEEHEEYEGVC